MKGVAVPYIVALILGILVIGLLGYWFFVLGGQTGKTSAELSNGLESVKKAINPNYQPVSTATSSQGSSSSTSTTTQSTSTTSTTQTQQQLTLSGNGYSDIYDSSGKLVARPAIVNGQVGIPSTLTSSEYNVKAVSTTGINDYILKTGAGGKIVPT